MTDQQQRHKRRQHRYPGDQTSWKGVVSAVSEQGSRVLELIEHYRNVDDVALYDITAQSAVYLGALLNERFAAADTDEEREYWQRRAMIVHHQKKQLRSGDRLGMIAQMDAWDAEIRALEAVTEAA